MEHLIACPVCGHSEFQKYLDCKDYTVSRETFTIVQCLDCGFRFTNPRPEKEVIGKYYESEEYVSHSNTSMGLVNSLYQIVRGYTLNRKLRLISSFTGGKSILDIGCGTGEFLGTCKRAGWNTLGIEPSSSARDLAIKNHLLEVLNEESLLKIPSESFDIITMWHVLEHVPLLQERVKELKRIIKPGGTVLIAVPNCSSADAGYYREFWAAYDVPRHLYHFRPNDIQKLFEMNGMKIEGILPMSFDSFYVSMLSEKYKHGSSRILNAVWRGLLSNLSARRKGRTFSSQIYLIRR